MQGLDRPAQPSLLTLLAVPCLWRLEEAVQVYMSRSGFSCDCSSGVRGMDEMVVVVQLGVLLRSRWLRIRMLSGLSAEVQAMKA